MSGGGCWWCGAGWGESGGVGVVVLVVVPAGVSPAVSGGAGGASVGGVESGGVRRLSTRPAGFSTTTPASPPLRAPPPAPAPRRHHRLLRRRRVRRRLCRRVGCWAGACGAARVRRRAVPPGSAGGPAPAGAAPVRRRVPHGLGYRAGSRHRSLLRRALTRVPPAAPPPMFNPANVGISPRTAFWWAERRRDSRASHLPTLPADFSHHADAGLMPPGAGGIPPAAPIAPQVAPTPVSPATAPTAGSGDWHSAIPAEQPSAPQASSPSYSSPGRVADDEYVVANQCGLHVVYDCTIDAYPAVRCPPTARTCGPRPRPCQPGRRAFRLRRRQPVTHTRLTNNQPRGWLRRGSCTSRGGASELAPSSSQQPAPTGIAGKAVAAGAGGAVAGAVSADATARIRLQRIVDAVARQESRLAWAAGDRPDDTTVLITDLAGGWIPPGIDIPAAVTLLEPGRRRGDLEALLGEVKSAVTHTPDRYVPEADEPVPTSPRPRHAPEIEELGWELGSATLLRDGLPRLAHTLAKAASSGTGVDPSEVELLQQHMHDVGERVLDAYPDEVDPNDVGNWQLLAAIEALIRGDRTGANYHLAWFQACMASVTGQHVNANAHWSHEPPPSPAADPRRLHDLRRGPRATQAARRRTRLRPVDHRRRRRSGERRQRADEPSSATGCRWSCSTAANTATGNSTSPGCARIWPTGDFSVNLVAHQVTVYGGHQSIHRC